MRRFRIDAINRFSALLLGIAVLLFPADGLVQDVSGADFPGGVTVLLSMKIKPYMDAWSGMQETFEAGGRPGIRAHFLNEDPGKTGADLPEWICQDGRCFVVAVGPEAMVKIWKEEAFADGRAFTMVLNPSNLTTNALASDCGVSLNIPFDVQLAELAVALPRIKRIGVLYDPQFNGDSILEIQAASPPLGVEVVPIAVGSRGEIHERLIQGIQEIECLWMIPDRTVIAESVVRYLIKTAMAARLPVVGYNRFFYENGAVLAFIFDYQQIGRQTANLVAERLAGRPCRVEEPDHEVWINERVAGVLKVSVQLSPDAGIVSGP